MCWLIGKSTAGMPNHISQTPPDVMQVPDTGNNIGRMTHSSSCKIGKNSNTKSLYIMYVHMALFGNNSKGCYQNIMTTEWDVEE